MMSFHDDEPPITPCHYLEMLSTAAGLSAIASPPFYCATPRAIAAH